MSFKYRIALVIFILEAIMMTVVFGFTLTQTQKVNQEQYYETEKVILSILGDLSRIALVTLEFDELQPYIERITKDPHVVKVLVMDKRGKVVAASNGSKIGGSMPVFKDSGSTFWRTLRLSSANAVLGTVAIEFTHEALIKVNQEVISKGVHIAAVGMIAIAVVGLITGFLLTRRLEVVSHAARQIAQGNLKTKTGFVGKDEVSLLGQVFDEMADSFKQYIEELQNEKTKLKQARDTLEEKVAERTAELQYLALHDALTGLPNRALFNTRLDEAIASARLQRTSVALLMIDLNRFKEINDTLGHNAGDKVLEVVAARLKNALRGDDTIARLGGDEFAILLPATTEEQALHVSQHILEVLEPSIQSGQHDLSVGCSIGIALYPQHATEQTLLVQRADIAMYIAKRNGYGCSVYNAELDLHSKERLSLASDLHRALAQDEFKLHYQPKIDFATGRVVGAEALIRWEHDGRLIMPEQFIGIAEQNGMINSLTLWVLEHALRQAVEWNAQNVRLNISVNLSTKNLDDPQLTEQLLRLLEQSRVNPAEITLEITETGVMANPYHSLKVLEKIDSMGVGLSIDDFGTGYSSLIYLKKLPVDEIKIDRSFVTDMLADAESTVIVRSIIDLAHNLSLKVVAEGVETAEVWNALQRYGCDLCQGYFTGRPMPAEAVARIYHGSGLKVVLPESNS